MINLVILLEEGGDSLTCDGCGLTRRKFYNIRGKNQQYSDMGNLLLCSGCTRPIARRLGIVLPDEVPHE